MDITVALTVAFSAVGGFIVSLLGGADALLYTLILLMVLDIGLGITLSVCHLSPNTKSGKFSSTELYRGLFIHFSIFFIIIVAVALDSLLQATITIADVETTLVRSIVILFYIVWEASSILENLALIGVPLPAKLMDTLDIIRSSNNLQTYRRRKGEDDEDDCDRRE